MIPGNLRALVVDAASKQMELNPTNLGPKFSLGGGDPRRGSQGFLWGDYG